LTPPIRYLWPEGIHFPFSGKLHYSHPDHPSANLTGHVAVIALEETDDDYDAIERLVGTGVEAVILLSFSPVNWPGQNQHQRHRVKRALVHSFPVFDMTLGQNASLEGWWQNQTNGIFVTFDSEEHNPWDYVYKYFVPIISNLLLVMSGVTLIIACYKQSLLVMVNGWQRSIAQKVLVINIICLILRFVWLASDPWGAYGTTPGLWVQIGMTLPFAFSLIGALLITLYWHELIQKASGGKATMFLGKLRIPFWIIAGMLFAWELSVSIVRGFGSHAVTVLVILDGIIYALITLSLLIFFIITKVRLNRVFEKLNKSLGQSKKDKLGIASNIVLCMGAVMIWWIIALILLGIGSFIWIPDGFVGIWSILMIGMNVMALMQVLLIRAPYRSWRWIFCGLFADDPQSLMDDDTSLFAEDSSKVKSNDGSQSP
jgi:hypothetical protein